MGHLVHNPLGLLDNNIYRYRELFLIDSMWTLSNICTRLLNVTLGSGGAYYLVELIGWSI